MRHIRCMCTRRCRKENLYDDAWLQYFPLFLSATSTSTSSYAAAAAAAKKEILLFFRLQRHKNLKCKSTNERKIVANKIENDKMRDSFPHSRAASIEVMHNNVNAQCTCSTISNHVTAICIQWVCVRLCVCLLATR